MSIQAFIQWFLPREEHFYDMLEELARLSHDAAIALARFSGAGREDVRKSVQEIEHRADDVVRKMEEALAKTFVTPIDREDLHRLTSELDDIVDLTNLTARALELFHIQRPTEAVGHMMSKLVTVTELIRNAVPLLRKKNFAGLIEAKRKIRALEKEADVVYRSAISNLFGAQQIDVRELLKEKEALDGLERAVDHCDNVADLLSNLAVKHG